MIDENIAQIRAFNRYYTSVIGLLDKYLNSDFSLTEVRIMYELYHYPQGMTASGLIELLNLDKGYLSRILRSFEKKQLIEKRQDNKDKRSYYLQLSETGKTIFSELSNTSQQKIVHLLSSLSDEQINELVGHMNGISSILKTSNLKKNEK